MVAGAKPLWPVLLVVLGLVGAGAPAPAAEMKLPPSPLQPSPSPPAGQLLVPRGQPAQPPSGTTPSQPGSRPGTGGRPGTPPSGGPGGFPEGQPLDPAAPPPIVDPVLPPAPPPLPAPWPLPATVPAGPHVPRQVALLLRGTDPQAAATAAALEAAYGLRRLGLHRLHSAGVSLGLFEVAPGADVMQVIAQLERDPRPLLPQPNHLFHLYGEAAPPAGLRYALRRMRADEARRRATGRGALVAVIDTEVDETHPDLRGRVAEKASVVVQPAAPGEAGHGTAIASLVAGRESGVAPGARLLAIRAFSVDRGRPGAPLGTTQGLALALDTAVQRRPHVINMSFGGPRDRILALLVGQALKAGALPVAAAGNSPPDRSPSYPAALAGVLAVSATDMEDRPYPQATRGDHVAVVAPGVDVVAAVPGPGWNLHSGTSFAAAHVAGVAALLHEARPGLGPAEVSRILRETAVDLGPPGRDPEFGAGRVDAVRALEAALSLGARR